MTLAKCPRCGKLFGKVRSLVCSSCTEEEESDYERVRAYLQDHPNQNAKEVAEGAKVSVEVVLRMLDEGLIQNTAVNTGVKCGRCGAPAISATKKLCERCLAEMNAELAKQTAAMRTSVAKPRQAGMYIAPDRKK